MLERLVLNASDRDLNKINALDLAAREGLDEETVIAALLNAARLGLFEMSWNVMCPSCAGVLAANTSLKTLDRAQYSCAFCAAGYETTFDNLVKVTSAVSPRLRKIPVHRPDELPAAEYYLLELGDRSSGRSGETAAGGHARNRRPATRQVRLRSDHAYGPVPRRQGRSDKSSLCGL